MTYSLTRTVATTCAVASVSALLATSLIAGPASAVTPTVSAQQASELQSRMVDLGVKSSDVEDLTRTVAAGQRLDAEVPGTAPVSTSERTEGGYRVTTDRFEDGSVNEYGIEVGTPEDAPTTNGQGISGCTYGSNGGVKYGQNCHVYFHGINWSSSFNADWSSWSGGSSATYRSATAKTVSWLSVGNEKVSKIESGTRIRYSLNLSAAGWGNTPFWLDMKVNSSGAHVYISAS
jgi:hypothetical protein